MKLIITTGSATYAQKANRVLNGMNIKNKIIKRQNTSGCGYGVETTDGDAEKITTILRDAGVKITDVRREE